MEITKEKEQVTKKYDQQMQTLNKASETEKTKRSAKLKYRLKIVEIARKKEEVANKCLRVIQLLSDEFFEISKKACEHNQMVLEQNNELLDSATKAEIQTLSDNHEEAIESRAQLREKYWMFAPAK